MFNPLAPILNLINLYRTHRDELRAKPLVAVRVFWRDGPVRGLLILTIGITTDIAIERVDGNYAMTSSLKAKGYWKPQTSFSSAAIYPDKEYEIPVFTFKIDVADEVRKKELEANVPITLSYHTKTGEKYNKNFSGSLKRGSSEFEITKT